MLVPEHKRRSIDAISKQTLFAVILSEASHEQLQVLIKDLRSPQPQRQALSQAASPDTTKPLLRHDTLSPSDQDG